MIVVFFINIYVECPDNYFSYNEHCYGFGEKKSTWSDARDGCKSQWEGYDLVVINDEKENSFLKNKIESKLTNINYWIGLKGKGSMDLSGLSHIVRRDAAPNNVRDSKDKFRWIDGSDLSTTDWKKGEPKDVRINIGLRFWYIALSILQLCKFSLNY